MSANEAEKINENLPKDEFAGANGMSEEKNVQKETTDEQAQSEKNAGNEKSEDPQAKYNELNEKYIRLFSDFDNFRKRSLRERIELIKSAGEDVIIKLLPVLDDFERAIKSNEKSKENKSLLEGIVLIYQKMKNILSQQGLIEMEIKDGEFNPDLHDAITNIPASHENQKGKIIDVIEKGYYLNDKVIRHAKVVVGE